MLPAVNRALAACVACAALHFVAPGAARAQTSGAQLFVVSVPADIRLTAPAAVTLTHNTSNGNQVFPLQDWRARGNVRRGVTVSLATDHSFWNTDSPTTRRDAQLRLFVQRLTGPGRWRLNQPLDRTRTSAGDELAVVQASSNGAGEASLRLRVVFLGGNYAILPGGDYQMTVTGTITPNP
jgi:hypothetical protein